MLTWKPINSIYTYAVKPIFFRFDPELVHDIVAMAGRILGSNPVTRYAVRRLLSYRNPMLEQTVAGTKFINPVGLSAGFDKNAQLLNILPQVGFGHMEIGSVTYKPYKGNPKPRLYRLKRSKGLVVYYGLKSDGVEKIAPRFKRAVNTDALVGISVAKTNAEYTASNEGGVKDYVDCLKYLEKEEVGDYYTINISCPNTFGGEPFTTPERLEMLLAATSKLKISKPTFVKMPINLPFEEFEALLKVIVKYKLSGVVIGNLTKERDPELILDQVPEHVKGGISGKPTQALSNALISYTYEKYGDKLIIVGVGGIFSAKDAYEKIKRGATLLQLITGMIFEGPQLIGEVNRGLVKLLEQDGYKHISEATGANTKR